MSEMQDPNLTKPDEEEFPEHGNEGNDVETERTATPEDFAPKDDQEG